MNHINELRKMIRQTDKAIIKSLAKRQELSRQIGHLKWKQGLNIIDPAREKMLFDLYNKLSIKYNLEENYVTQLFKIIISYSRMVQNSCEQSKLYQTQ